jgi:hypothetical protein
MNAAFAVIRTLALVEARVRLRRLSTLVTLLGVVALSWLMISDPADGLTLIAVRGARVLYTSAALALGSAALAALVLALAGFYLLRGRVAEDLRSGAGAVIGASRNGGAAFVLGRWCGGVLYLTALVGAFMATVLLCHAVRGEGPIQPLVYLQTYALVLGPMILFTAGCATLFDAWAPLMGKKGDVLYFLVWVGQMALLPTVAGDGAATVVPFDFTGTSAVIATLAAHIDLGDSLTLGIADFQRDKAPLVLPTWVWPAAIAGARCVTALLAPVRRERRARADVHRCRRAAPRGDGPGARGRLAVRRVRAGRVRDHAGPHERHVAHVSRAVLARPVRERQREPRRVGRRGRLPRQCDRRIESRVGGARRACTT